MNTGIEGVHWDDDWGVTTDIKDIFNHTQRGRGWFFFFFNKHQFFAARNLTARHSVRCVGNVGIREIRWWAISQPFLLRIQNSSNSSFLLLLFQAFCLPLKSFSTAGQKLLLHQLEHLNFHLMIQKLKGRQMVELRQRCELKINPLKILSWKTAKLTRLEVQKNSHLFWILQKDDPLS